MLVKTRRHCVAAHYKTVLLFSHLHAHGVKSWVCKLRHGSHQAERHLHGNMKWIDIGPALTVLLFSKGSEGSLMAWCQMSSLPAHGAADLSFRFGKQAQNFRLRMPEASEGSIHCRHARMDMTCKPGLRHAKQAATTGDKLTYQEVVRRWKQAATHIQFGGGQR